MRSITGAQSEVYYVHRVAMKVGGRPFLVEVGFLRGLSARYSYGVVGQGGFFDIFIVKFDLIKEEVELLGRKKK